MKYPKSDKNACPECGLPRGKGEHEFAHGKCMEIRAKKEGNVASEVTVGGYNFTVEQVARARYNRNIKKYMSGKLPSWMYS